MGYRNNKLFAQKTLLDNGGGFADDAAEKAAKRKTHGRWNGAPWNKRADLRRQWKGELERHGMRSKCL